MIDRDDITVCVEIAQRSYLALQWLNRMLGGGILPVDGVHDDLTPQETARRWVRRFHPQFPRDAQPPEGELDRFANYFATYLLTSFDLVEGATQVRPGTCGCWCPWCRRIVDTPNLQPAKPGRRDRERAVDLMRNAVDELASECGASAADADWVFADPELQEVIAMIAYAVELQRRCAGATSGPATLVLWRRFAWNAQGSPKHDFRLRAKDIFTAEERLHAALLGGGEVLH